jgi:hypothetical protein
MGNNMYGINKIQKIIETKSKAAELLDEICYINNEIHITDIAKTYNINFRTAKKLKDKSNMKAFLSQIKIDRALHELLFSHKEQIECFEYLTTDLNYFKKYEDVRAHVAISRYNYKKVKDYITKELQSLTNNS